MVVSSLFYPDLLSGKDMKVIVISGQEVVVVIYF